MAACRFAGCRGGRGRDEDKYLGTRDLIQHVKSMAIEPRPTGLRLLAHKGYFGSK